VRSAVLAAAVTALFALTAVLATVLLAGLDATRTYATPTPSPNQEPRP
jgi:hypothetical protein